MEVVFGRLISMSKGFLMTMKRLEVVSGRPLVTMKRLLTTMKRLEVAFGCLLTMSKGFLMMRNRSRKAMKRSIAISERRSATRNHALTKNRRRPCRFLAPFIAKTLGCGPLRGGATKERH